ncbi:MAG: hypothetical protein ACK5PC_14105 [Cyclobacteriaceae bacterium]|nr:hypothetical protein [Flammeovirgaceae bacterium]
MDKLSKTLIILVLTTSSCSETTRLDSDEFSTAEERVEILKQEVKCFSDIKDTEFELFNVNGFHNSSGPLVPGASSWDYKFAIRVDTVDITKWREGMIKFDPQDYDDTWTKEITKDRRENWLTSSPPTYYVRQGEKYVTMVEFYLDGIIFKRVITRDN